MMYRQTVLLQRVLWLTGGETKDKVKAGKTGVGQSGKSVAKNSELLAYILATTAVTAFAVMLVVRRFNAEER